MSKPNVEIAAFVGLDWADQKHVVTVQEANREQRQRFTLDQTPEALQSWIQLLRNRFAGRPVAIAVEQKRGALIYALMHVDFLHLYPVNPQTLAQFRKAFYPSGAKDDPVDADLLLEILMTHRQHLRLGVPDDVRTRSIQWLTEDRRHLVDERTALTNQLTAALKMYFPQALEWFGDRHTARACAFLQRWPTLQQLPQATPSSVRKFYKVQGYRGEDKLEQLMSNIKKAQPLTQDGAVLLAGAMKVQALVTHTGPSADGIGPTLRPKDCFPCLLNMTIRPCLAASPARDLRWLLGSWPHWGPIAAASNSPLKCNNSPALPQSPKKAAPAFGFIGAWPVRSSCGKPFRSLRAVRFLTRTGRELFMTN